MPTNNDDPKSPPKDPAAPRFPKPPEPQARTIPKPAAPPAAPPSADAAPKATPVETVAGPVKSEKAADPVVVSTPRAPPPETSASASQKPRMAFVDPTLQAVDAMESEALAIGITSDVRPLAGFAGVVDWRLCGRLSDLVRKGVLSGALREKVLVPTLGMIPAKRIFLFGWGPRAALLDGATEKFAWMVDVLLKAKIEKVAIALPEPAGLLLGLVEDHLRKPLGDRCGTIYAPDALMPGEKDTRPIAAPAFTSPGA